MIDLANYPDIIPTQKTSESNAGLLLTFPTGKTSLNDLTQQSPRNRRIIRSFQGFRSASLIYQNLDFTSL